MPFPLGQPAGDPPVGLAGQDPDLLAERVLTAWDAFLDVAENTDLSAPSRLPGWSGRDVCVHLGSWQEAEPLAGVLASARAGLADAARTGDGGEGGNGSGATWSAGAGRGTATAEEDADPHPRATDPDAANERLVLAHRDAGDDEVLAALVRARDAVETFFDSPDVRALGRAPATSSLGTLPVLTVVHASCYELAVHALDLEPCGAPVPPTDLLLAGLSALVDVTGALASRLGIRASVTGQTPDGGWRLDVDGGHGWETRPVPPGPVPGTAVLAEAPVLLDASAGRAAVPNLLLTRRLRVQDLPSFMALAPLVEAVPGIPGGAALRVAARTVSGLHGLLSKIRRAPR